MVKSYVVSPIVTSSIVADLPYITLSLNVSDTVRFDQFLIDTGSSQSILKKHYRKLLRGLGDASNVKLNAVNGSQIDVFGRVDLEVLVKGNRTIQSFLVADVVHNILGMTF